MKNQKIESMLLKELYDPNLHRTGLRYRLPGNEVLVINPSGTAAFIFDALEPFHLADRLFPFTERLPFKPPALDAENRLTATGDAYKKNHGTTPRLIFTRPNGVETYIDAELLKFFDKKAELYQQDSRLSIVAVVERQAAGEDRIAGYVMPCHPPVTTNT